jgi:hypothetical protein
VGYASERAAALIRHALDALRRGEDAEQLSFELGMVTKQEGAAAVATTFDAIYRETEAEAKLHGPGSEAAQRLALNPLLLKGGSKRVSRSRRQKGNTDEPSTRSRTAQRLLDLTAVKILDTTPSDEPVIAIPAKEGGSRLLMRIGRREFSWVGSFAQGNNGLTTVHLMPDGHVSVAVP